MMTDKQINDLLDRFMAGETSEQEERLLTDYFCTRTDIPEAWAAYAVMFRGFRQLAAHEVPIRHYHHRWWLSAAAAILVLLGFWWYLPERESQPETVARTETPAPKPTVQPAVEDAPQPVAMTKESKPKRKVRAAKPHDAVEAEPAEVSVSEGEAVAEAVTEIDDPATDLLNIDMAAVQQQGAELRTALAIMNQELFESE